MDNSTACWIDVQATTNLKAHAVDFQLVDRDTSNLKDLTADVATKVSYGPKVVFI